MTFYVKIFILYFANENLIVHSPQTRLQMCKSGQYKMSEEMHLMSRGTQVQIFPNKEFEFLLDLDIVLPIIRQIEKEIGQRIEVASVKLEVSSKPF